MRQAKPVGKLNHRLPSVNLKINKIFCAAYFLHVENQLTVSYQDLNICSGKNVVLEKAFMTCKSK